VAEPRLVDDNYTPYSRPLTLVLLCGYFAGGYALGGPKLGLAIIFVPLIVLPCIWWPGSMAVLRGLRSVELPPSWVWFLGWVVFLSPATMAVVMWLEGVRASDF